MWLASARLLFVGHAGRETRRRAMYVARCFRMSIAYLGGFALVNLASVCAVALAQARTVLRSADRRVERCRAIS